MIETVLLLLVGFELKHFFADYLLQSRMMIAGKGDLGAIGGYAHAGLHAALSLAVMLLAGVPIAIAAGLAAAELVVHYLLDFSKTRYARGANAQTDPWRFWALHGVDQLAHHLTYVAMIYLCLRALGY